MKFAKLTILFRCLLVGAIGLLAVSMFGCGKRASDTLIVYSAGPRSLADWVCREFEKETGIPTKLFSATTGEIMAKLQAEEGSPLADVVILASPSAAEALKDSGSLAKLPDDLPVRSDWTDPDAFYTGTSACAIGIALRKDSLSRDLEWSEIWDGRFPGSLIMPSPSQSGSSAEFVIAFDIAHGEEFWDGLKSAKSGGLQISGPNSQALTGLILGSHEAVLAAADYLVFKQIASGEPLAVHYPMSGCPVVPRPIAILKNARNPDGAEEFVRFFFSSAVQSEVAREHLIPADPTIPYSAERQAAGAINEMELDVEKAMERQRSVLRRFQMEIEKAL